MNINDLATHYVTYRRTLGERCQTNEAILRSFCQSIGPQTPAAAIGADVVAAFLAGTGPVTSAWHIKYHALKGFFRFAVSRGHLGEAPLPAVLPKQPPRFVPYIYSRDDLRRLLDAIPSYRRYRTRIQPETFRAILLLLYGSGLRAREALDLTVADVDLPNAMLTVRDTKFFKCRLVPIGWQLTGVLTEYARWRAVRYPSFGDESRFFLGKRGAAIHLWALEDAFQRLREHAKVHRSKDARYQPRLHDLRHTFAVHRLTERLSGKPGVIRCKSGSRPNLRQSPGFGRNPVYFQGFPATWLGFPDSLRVVPAGGGRTAAPAPPVRVPRARPSGGHAGLPDHDPGVAARGRHSIRAVRARGGRPCVTLPCSGLGSAGS